MSGRTGAASRLLSAAYYTRWRQYCQWMVVGTIWVLCHTIWRVTITQQQNIPNRDAPGYANYLIACTHMSNWDPPFISYAMRWHAIAYMAKKELFEHWLTRTIYQFLGAFPVNRERVEKSSLKNCITVLTQTDWRLALFPEGTRHRDYHSIGSFKSGVCSIARMGRAPILPMSVVQRGRHIEIVIGELMPVPRDVEASSAQLAECLLKLKREAVSRLGIMVGETP